MAIHPGLNSRYIIFLYRCNVKSIQNVIDKRNDMK